jgi:uncharacterized phage protein (TIGR01671 family)
MRGGINMRELKFRAWDKYHKVFRSNVDVVLFTKYSTHDPFLKMVHVDNYNNKDNDFNNDRIVIQQYTGLKDINNKELYEGDIVKILPNNYIALAEYSQESCAYLLKNKNGYRGYFSIIQEGFEVIGNIYENPELLENHT